MNTAKLSSQKRLGVFFRVDGSAKIGIGHVNRCRTIADALRERGLETVFLIRTLAPELEEMLIEKGHDVRRLRNDVAPAPTSTDEYACWLGTTETYDAACVADVIRQSEDVTPLALVADHYGLNYDWEEQVITDCRIPILAIDDLDRHHAATTIIDTTFGKGPAHYKDVTPDGSELLIGSEFALLRPEFLRQRSRSIRSQQERFAEGTLPISLLVSLGGGDPDNALGFLLPALLEQAPELGLTIHALVGSVYPHFDSLTACQKQNPDHLTIHRDVGNVAELLGQVDVCIGAAGTSTWERCCLGVPSINIVIAENQKTIDRNLSQANIVVSGGEYVHEAGKGHRLNGLTAEKWVEQVFLPFFKDVELQRTLNVNSSEIIDGGGTIRAIGSIFSNLPINLPVTLVHALEKDASIVYEWQCFPGLRRYFRSPDVPDWSDHIAWFSNRLRDSPRRTWMIDFGGIPAGFIRLDASDKEQFAAPDKEVEEISIIVAPELQGRGIARRALFELLENPMINNVLAHVLPDNTASQRLFRKCGFEEIGHDYYLFSKRPDSCTGI